MFYLPQYEDVRYKRKIVLFPISINGNRYAWQFIYVKQRYGIACWHDVCLVSKEVYLKWKKGT